MLSFLFGCSTTKKIDALKPEPSLNTPVVYNTTTSFVNMPMEVTLKEVEHQLNKSLVGLIYEDANMDDDKTVMKIWKTANIKLVEKNGKIQSVLPLKIWAKFKYGTEFMGLNDTREIEANGTITLLSNVSLSNFKMTTESVIEDFAWIESPTILVAGKKVPITYILTPTLSIFKSKVSKKIDEAIDKTCDFKPYVLDVLETISKPIQTSEQYETWFKMVPIEMYNTDAVLKNGKVALDLGLKCNMQTIVGQDAKNRLQSRKYLLLSNQWLNCSR
jgi:hypothetical protein